MSRLGVSGIWEMIPVLLILKYGNLLLWSVENEFLVNKHLELKWLLAARWSHSNHLSNSLESAPECQTKTCPPCSRLYKTVAILHSSLCAQPLHVTWQH